ncbi:hypothetical protein BDK51DRAFT_30772 [Blyttiomyces helicus]|uniref:Uncharacterized protein n=1 Tax=Blyttiomyces helicus TaxID=388810 RepID=A0A4P9WR29_9FUNG|nr:hypothetical protein BDK51DRAFT_30772 [Blyttiomyces helicus]|eukprot:RKO93690.1 hypothetical protein BDK51DRAFT_30772 [Blyttiomyces helicus]
MRKRVTWHSSHTTKMRKWKTFATACVGARHGGMGKWRIGTGRDLTREWRMWSKENTRLETLLNGFALLPPRPPPLPKFPFPTLLLLVDGTIFSYGEGDLRQRERGRVGPVGGRTQGSKSLTGSGKACGYGGWSQRALGNQFLGLNPDRIARSLVAAIDYCLSAGKKVIGEGGIVGNTCSGKMVARPEVSFEPKYRPNEDSRELRNPPQLARNLFGTTPLEQRQAPRFLDAESAGLVQVVSFQGVPVPFLRQKSRTCRFRWNRRQFVELGWILPGERNRKIGQWGGNWNIL